LQLQLQRHGCRKGTSAALILFSLDLVVCRCFGWLQRVGLLEPVWA